MSGAACAKAILCGGDMQGQSSAVVSTLDGWFKIDHISNLLESHDYSEDLEFVFDKIEAAAADLAEAKNGLVRIQGKLFDDLPAIP